MHPAATCPVTPACSSIASDWVTILTDSGLHVFIAATAHLKCKYGKYAAYFQDALCPTLIKSPG